MICLFLFLEWNDVLFRLNYLQIVISIGFVVFVVIAKVCGNDWKPLIMFAVHYLTDARRF